MIEADGGKLTEFLKGQGTNLSETALSVPVSKPLSTSPVIEKAQDMGNSVETIVKLLESVNKLINSDLVSNMMSKGIERKSQALAPPPVQEVPEGFMPVNSNVSNESSQAPEPKINYQEKADLIIKALDSTIKNLVETKDDRTIKEIYEEFNQEEVKEHFKTQVKMLLEN